MNKKKVFAIVASAAAIITIAGCGKELKPVETTVTTKSKDATANITNTGGITQPTTHGASELSDADKALMMSSGEVDLDLTKLSATMVYSEIYNMMVSPENYVGKKIRINGLYATATDSSTGKNYFAVINQDATKCCSQGIEFELVDSYKYPEDYPKADSTIIVEGTFDTYKEGNTIYCVLRNAKIVG